MQSDKGKRKSSNCDAENAQKLIYASVIKDIAMLEIFFCSDLYSVFATIDLKLACYGKNIKKYCFSFFVAARSRSNIFDC